MDKFIKILRIILVLIFLSWGISWISVRGHYKELKDRNIVESLVVEAGNLPSVLKQWFIANYKKPEQAIEIKRIKDLYRIGEFPKNSTISDSIHLLYYKYLGGDKGKVYLQNIKNGDIAYSWDIPLSKIMDDQKKIEKNLKEKYYKDSIPVLLSAEIRKNIAALEICAPIISKDSSLIFQCGSLGYLYKLDKNSKLLWHSTRLVHHSIELDEKGNIWTCSVDLKNKTANYYEYREDAILCLSPSGDEKEFLPLTDIFKSNKLFKKLIASSPIENDDPYHINDILPVNEDGKYWKKGDLFLSLRNKSMVFLYRPSTRSIVWYKRENWSAQHDINIINDSVISVFNNNALFFKKQDLNISSNIAFYNFADKQTVFKYKNIFNSTFEGRQTQIENKGLLIEETGGAKYYMLDSLGAVTGKFYIPYFSDSTRAMNPTWARAYLKKGDKFIIQ